LGIDKLEAKKMKDKNKEQYTNAELKKMGIKLHIDSINLSLINKKK